jgi:hypothetical protein
LRTSADTTSDNDKPRHHRILLAALFSVALLLSGFLGVGASTAAQDDTSPESSFSELAEAPREESSVTPTPSSQPSESATQKDQEEESASSEPSAEEKASESSEPTPTEDPTPEVTEAKITVQIAHGLSGVKLQLHADKSGKSGAAIQEAWASCVSNGDGVCTFTVPETHAADEGYDAGEHYDKRFWVVQKSAPSGWYLNEELGLNGNSTRRYELQTGKQLRAGQTYSAGSFHLSRANPGASLACRPGADLGVVLDRTGSAGTKAATAMQEAVTGSNSSVTVYDGASSTTQGLKQAAGSGHDLVVVATSGSAGDFAATEQAIDAANALKAQGTRIVAVGLGSTNHANLRAISGTQSSQAATYSGADYHALGNGQFAGFLDSIVQKVACETTVTVTQQTQAYGQDSATNGGAGWEFKLTTEAGTVKPSPKQTTNSDGMVSYDLKFNASGSAAHQVNLEALLTDEQVEDGWAVEQITCASATSDGSTATLSVAPGDDVECTVRTVQTLKSGLQVQKLAWDTPHAADVENAQRLKAGAHLPSGHRVTWTYELTNTGETPLKEIKVVDDQLPGGALTCPATTLKAGASMTCTASGKVTAKP